jgi:probable F420-dependent oxidoreductase
MDLGIGRGDSAQRMLGRTPVTARTLDRAVGVIRDLVEGRSTAYQDAEIQLTWTGRWELPVWIAGYGPIVLGMTGRVADGVILQLAEVDLIAWMAGMVRTAATEAGRDPASIRVQAAAPAHVGPIELARERVRWFPALVSNHVVDLVNTYPRDQLPESLTGYVRDREGYDYRHHAEVGSDNARFVSDEVADRFSIVGPPEEHVRRLLELHDAGVDQFNLYLMNGDEEEELEIYGRDIIPAVRAALGERAGTDTGAS